MSESTHVVVASNFTAEPVESSLRFWLSRLQLSASIELSPYDQLFQQLLRSDSALLRNDGVGILLVRIQDWLREEASPNDASRIRDFNDVVADFVQAACTAVGKTSSQLIVCLCPPIGVAAGSQELELLCVAEDQIAADLSQLPGMEIVSSSSIHALYPMDDYEFEQGRRIANIPYTTEFFGVLGTVLARRMYSILLPSQKVLVLDCDDTLWGGLCSELGPTGVEIARHHLELQSFVIEQQRAGKLICLASRNNEGDVLDVFGNNPSMLLTREHLAAWEINWGLKSDGLERLSGKLGLGLDSFIFFDDDPVQCAEVARRFPEVLTFQVPGSDVGRFCRHIWPLDSHPKTELSNRRTIVYREHMEREDVRTQSLSFEEFIENLQLDVSIAPLVDRDVPRALELAQRTNQFNLAGLKMTESEIRSWIADDRMRCLSVRAKDRFGDYGLVGLLFCKLDDEALNVPVFLLSCRALGRGVEHQMLGYLGKLAQQHRIPRVALSFKSTTKNTPALEFLQQRATFNAESKEATDVALDAGVAASARLDPEASPVNRAGGAERPATAPVRNLLERNRFLSSIPAQYSNADAINEAIGGQSSPALAEPTRATTDPVDAMLIAAFCKQLEVDNVGLDDGFFDLGGHSLQAVMILAQASAEFGVELDPTLLFTTGFSIAELSQEIGFLLSSEKKDMAGILSQLSAITDSDSS